ncbi:MAG: EAL domain-containing response regulator [Chloroflexota bacterium]
MIESHSSAHSGTQPGSSCVLVVDDEPTVLAALTRMLRTSEIRVLTASNGEQALAMLEAGSPVIGVVMSDYSMPGMNGVELLHTVRMRWPDVVRVLLTGRADLPTAARAINDGQVARLFVKPWDPSELQGEIAGLLAQADVPREQRQAERLHTELSPEQVTLMGQLRAALGESQLRLFYQPIARVATEEIVGVEALVRWEHPRLGLLPPDEFVALAEHTGLIQPLTHWVIRAALDQCRAWRAAAVNMPVSINLSMWNLLDPGLAETIATMLQSTGIPPDWLTVELTESAIMADPKRTLGTLEQLRVTGVQIALDDFGTGHSSLARLKSLPVDVVKLDKSFISHLATDSRDMAIARLSIGLGHDLGLQVLAEGVEDQLTWDWLARLGCDFAQGYYLGRPVPAVQLACGLQKTPLSDADTQRAA